MKKFLALMALLLCFTVLFVACNEDTPSTDEPTKVPDTPVVCNHQYDNDCDATCNLCGETRVPKAHVEVVIPAVEPTCEKAGQTAGKQCSVCGTVTVAPEVREASGHVEEVVPGTAATCTDSGLTEGKVCKVCNKTLVAQKVVYATGHTPENLEAKAPTCTETGLTSGKKCSVCDAILQAQEEVPAIDHVAIFGQYIAPTCTEDGYSGATVCAVCFEILDEGEVIPAYGHDAVAFDAVPATCTTVGYAAGTMCSECGEVLTGGEEVAPVAHTVVTVKGKAATCTATGLTDGTKCSVCGAVIKAQEVIPAAHGANVPMEDIEATCTTIGYVGGMKCEVCGVITVAQTIVPAGHIYTADCDDSCNRCGYVRPIVADHEIEYGTCKNCYVTDPAYDGLAMSMYDATHTPYDSENELYYMVDTNPKSNFSRDGYSWDERNDWQLSGTYGDHIKNQKNELSGVTWKDGDPIRVAATASHLEVKLFGWVKFGDMALDTFGFFVDGIDSTDEIYWNDSADVFMKNHLDLYNGTGLWAGAGLSGDVISLFGANARRYCMAVSVVNNIWEEMREEPGIHNIYIVARMQNGQLIVVTNFAIDVVAHDCSFPAEGTEGVGTVVPATCTTDGYTVVTCEVDAHGCPSSTIINRKPATGHHPSTEWTFLDGKHFHECLDCGTRFDEGTCAGTDGTHCDVCGSLYNCNHKYVVDVDGTVKCANGCGAIKHNAPEYFWTGADLVEGINTVPQFTNYKPTLLDNGAALFAGAGTDAGSMTVSLSFPEKTGKYIMIVYKANEDHQIWWCHYNPGEANGAQHTGVVLDASNEWGVKAIFQNTGNHIHGRADVRFNVYGSANCSVEIAYIAAFDDWGAYLSYVNDGETYQLPTMVEDGVKHGWNEGTVTKAPTCTETGTIVYNCTACDATRTAVLPALGHTVGDNVVVVEPTCLERGTKAYVCTACGELIVELIEKIPHVAVAIEDVAPTCTEAGHTGGKQCATCNTVYEEPTVVPATGHTPVKAPAVAPTCTSTGLEEGVVCSVCGEFIVAQEVVPMIPHTEVDIDKDVDPTCAPGHKTGKVCSVCGTVTVECQEVAPIYEHTWKDANSCILECTVCGYVSDGVHTWINPDSCMPKCKDCGYVQLGKEHSLKAGKCTVCGETDPAYAGLGILNLQDATDIPYDAENELYYMAKTEALENICLDGYSWKERASWQLTGSYGDHIKNVMNPNTGITWKKTDVIKIASNSERLDTKFFGWVNFGDMALDTYGIFVDGITSVDEIIWNDSAAVGGAVGYLDIYNGKDGILKDGGYSDGLIEELGSKNARRFCIATYFLNGLWNDIKGDAGVHTIYIVARMANGQLIVVTDYKIEVVNHTHTFPEDGTEGVGAVVAPTCTNNGYTVVGCLFNGHGCEESAVINEVPAKGHTPSTEWTFLDGKHYHQCLNCTERFDEGECKGQDNSHCDTCGSLYNCIHNYVVNADDGSVVCTGGCGAVKYPAPTYFWTGADIVNNYNEGGFGDYQPTLQDDGSALITGAHKNDGVGSTVSLKFPNGGGKYYVIVYKTNVANEIWWCHHNSAETGAAHTPISLHTSSGWTVAAVTNGANHIHGWNQVRLNITSDESCRTEIAYIATFDDWNAFLAYCNDSTTYQIPTIVD